jgi:hypothetical protein
MPHEVLPPRSCPRAHTSASARRVVERVRSRGPCPVSSARDSCRTENHHGRLSASSETTLQVASRSCGKTACRSRRSGESASIQAAERALVVLAREAAAQCPHQIFMARSFLACPSQEREMTDNWLLGTDTQQKDAAARHLLRAGQRQRYTAT